MPWSIVLGAASSVVQHVGHFSSIPLATPYATPLPPSPALFVFDARFPLVFLAGRGKLNAQQPTVGHVVIELAEWNGKIVLPIPTRIAMQLYTENPYPNAKSGQFASG